MQFLNVPVWVLEAGLKQASSAHRGGVLWSNEIILLAVIMFERKLILSCLGSRQARRNLSARTGDF